MAAKAQVSSYRSNTHVLLAAGECKEELAASSIAILPYCHVYVLGKYDTAARVVLAVAAA
jgi:hypothetical protein